MPPVLLALLFGAAVGLSAYALREPLRDRFLRDVAWLEGWVWRFTPEPFDGRKWVALFYVAAALLLVGLLAVVASPLVALGLWVLALFVPRIALAWRYRKRRESIREQLPPAVTRLASAVASGMSLIDAIERLGEREPEPVATEFAVMARYWRLGADFESTVEEARRRVDLQDFDLLASALVVNHRMGGNVVRTLERLSRSLQEIARMRREVYAATAEGRQSILTMFVAPFLMLGCIAFIDAPAVGMLFTTPFGNVLLAVAVTLDALGTLWAWKIVHADV